MFVVDFLKDFFLQTYGVFLESSIYILLGFFLAGLIDVFIKREWILRYMTGKGLKPIVNASLLGIPIPLCSCGVLPIALALDKKGGQKDATMSFLISTPETGIDSIVLTYGLLGPVFAIFRPIASFLTALIAGIFYGEEEEGATLPLKDSDLEDIPSDSPDKDSEKEDRFGMSFVRKKAAEVYNSGFIKLFDEVSVWILIGMIITGFLSALLPQGFFEEYLGSGLFSMIVMVLIGIPLYMCATSSTPIAAAFIAKGLNPGAAFVFLLAGPATNASTITVLLKQFGRRFIRVYLTTIITVSIILGLFLNYLLSLWGIQIKSVLQGGEVDSGNFLKFFGVLLFLFLLALSFKRLGLKVVAMSVYREMTTLFRGVKDYKWSEWYKSLVIWTILLISLGFYLSSTFFIVEPGEVGITKLFGKVQRYDLKPGLHFKFPYPFGSSVVCSTDFIRKVNVGFKTDGMMNFIDKDLTNYAFAEREKPDNAGRRVKLEEESFNLTGDENIIDITYSIHYKIKDPYKFTFGIEEPDELIRCAGRNALLESLACHSIDEIYTTLRKDIEELTLNKLKGLINDYDIGADIIGVHLLSVHAPEEVHFAFRDVASAAEDRNMMINKAYGEYEETVNHARGSAEKSILEAESYNFQKIAEATGNAKSFELQLRAYWNSRDLTEFRMYHEVLQRVLPYAKIYIKPSGKEGGEIELFIIGDKGSETLAKLPE